MEPENICIDTDLIIDFTKDIEPGAGCFEFVHEKFNCFITAISAYELRFGVEYAGRKQDIEVLEELLGNLTILPFDNAAAKVSAQIDAKLTKQGKKLSIKDIFIACICISNNIHFLTRNIRHFSPIPGIKVLSLEEIISSKGADR